MVIILQHVSVGIWFTSCELLPRVHCDMVKLAIPYGSTGNEVFSDEQDSK